MSEKEFYIKAICDLLEKCNNIPLLHMIYTILCKNA